MWIVGDDVGFGCDIGFNRCLGEGCGGWNGFFFSLPLSQDNWYELNDLIWLRVDN